MAPRPSLTGFAALLGEKVIQLAAVAIVNVVVLRALGPSQAGVYGSATALLAMALPLALFGQLAVVRYLVRTNDTRRLLSTALGLSCAGSVLGAVVLVLIAVFAHERGDTPVLLLILSLAMLVRPLSAFDAWFQASRLNHWAAAARTSAVIVSSILRIYVASTSESLVALAWVIVLENLLAGVLLIVFFTAKRRGKLPSIERRPSAAVPEAHPLREIIAMSLPLLASGLAVILYMRIDQPLLLWLDGSSSAGLYSAAANLSDASSFVPSALLTAVLPGLVFLAAKDRRSFLARSRRLVHLVSAGAFLIAVIGIACSPAIVSILYGSDYAQTGLLLQILFVGAPFQFLGVMRNIWVVSDGLQRDVLYLSLITVALNVVANLVFIPINGAVAAAWITVASHALNGVLGGFIFKSLRPMSGELLRSLNPIAWGGTVLNVVRERRI